MSAANHKLCPSFGSKQICVWMHVYPVACSSLSLPSIKPVSCERIYKHSCTERVYLYYVVKARHTSRVPNLGMLAVEHKACKIHDAGAGRNFCKSLVLDEYWLVLNQCIFTVVQHDGVYGICGWLRVIHWSGTIILILGHKSYSLC